MTSVLSKIITLLLISCSLNVFSKKKSPNVLFIVCDDLNTRVSSSGFPYVNTPAFQYLAKEGITFNRAYCQYPVCGPSRASFLSGLYPQSTGILDNKTYITDVRPNSPSMVKTFQENGYWTGGVGKVFHDYKNHHLDEWSKYSYSENDELPLVIPYREQFEKENGPITDRQNKKKWEEYALTIAPQTANQKPGYGPTGLKDEQHRDGKNVREMVSWIQNKQFGDQPFFMACGIHKPHGPYLAPDEYFDMYPKKDLHIEPASLDYWKQAPAISQTKRHIGYDFEFGVENDTLRRNYTQAYHACITFVDRQIQLLFDALKSEGLWDETIVVLTSDHGYLLGEKFMWGKVFLWDMGVNVPMVVKAPKGINKGQKTEGIIEMIDIFPTLAELCKVPLDKNEIHGRSFAKLLNNTKGSGKEVAYTVVRRRGGLGKSITTQQYHYILWPDNSEELYDLEKDPEEKTNLVHFSENKELIESLKAKAMEYAALALSKRTVKE